jgi:hypothetical protein
MFQAFQGGQYPNGLPCLLPRHPDFIQALQIQPEFRRRAEEIFQAQRRIASDGAPSIENFGDAVCGNAQSPPVQRRSFPTQSSSSAKCSRGELQSLP